MKFLVLLLIVAVVLAFFQGPSSIFDDDGDYTGVWDEDE